MTLLSPRQTFHVRLHDGWKGTIEVGTGVYQYAAAAVPAILGLQLPLDLEIWSALPQLADKRFNFRVCDNEFGQLVVKTLVPCRNGELTGVPKP
jgi:hypothetical protein